MFRYIGSSNRSVFLGVGAGFLADHSQTAHQSARFQVLDNDTFLFEHTCDCASVRQTPTVVKQIFNLNPQSQSLSLDSAPVAARLTSSSLQAVGILSARIVRFIPLLHTLSAFSLRVAAKSDAPLTLSKAGFPRTRCILRISRR